MFGQYKRLRNEFTGVLTGKGINWGGSLIRPEATGYGAVYFAQEMLTHHGSSLAGKTVLVSGSGNVAQFAIQKATELGGKVVTASDSSGFIHDPDGIDAEKLAFLMELKNKKRGRIKEYADRFGCSFSEGRPWSIAGEVAFPCATQNELNGEEAAELIGNGLKAVAEGANMPSTQRPLKHFMRRVFFSQGKASMRVVWPPADWRCLKTPAPFWTSEEVDQRLHGIMKDIRRSCVAYGQTEGGNIDYVKGANIAGFVKVADAMIDQGLV